MKENQFIINKMPVPTFRWLKMNEAKLEIPGELTTYQPSVEGKLPKRLTEENDFSGSMSTALDDYFREERLPVQSFVLKEGEESPEYIRMHFRNGENAVEHSAYCFTVEEGARLKLFLAIESLKESKNMAFLQEKFLLKKNAKLDLVIAVKNAKDFAHLQDFSFVLEEKAKLKLTSLLLSGKSHHISYQIDLNGDKSETDLHLDYVLSQKEKADFNLVVNHKGKKTISNIVADGVLREDAVKIFRGTIDLKHGAKGASGTEQENVLLMDDSVVNQTIPVILCDEDDVEGNHGASIGRLDEESLFYMESRGLSLEAAYELIAEARMESAIHGIMDKKVEEYIEAELREKRSEEE
ncbi:MAG: SufD family Fe-S cluster assembly protein [Oribacterium parvum]|uniref:SufB/SufD family protein n=1 Tax=Oribacterium parvum TaxID=1501329 RepID=UPI001CB187A3|nr:SufD family Fe-S cluster assembly protein [Oribacterium parvum]MBF1268408.1 SufD family Fe-S cluster assembly protein [Oribacterium parvum]